MRQRMRQTSSESEAYVPSIVRCADVHYPSAHGSYDSAQPSSFSIAPSRIAVRRILASDGSQDHRLLNRNIDSDQDTVPSGSSYWGKLLLSTCAPSSGRSDRSLLSRSVSSPHVAHKRRRVEVSQCPVRFVSSDLCTTFPDVSSSELDVSESFEATNWPCSHASASQRYVCAITFDSLPPFATACIFHLFMVFVACPGVLSGHIILPTAVDKF